MHAQNNVGINTTNPQAALDVRGNQRFGGTNRFTLFDSLTGRIQWSGATLYTPASQQIISHSASGEGLYAGGGRLEYRNTTDPVFYSDWTNGNGYFRNNLGINNLSPQFPLSFNGSLGDKISLWTDGTATHYGFGVQGGLLQMFSKTINDDIAFGYGSSTSFTERMRIKGNGNVGIGISTPNAPLTFPALLGKKITLYPGATGDVGLGVQGNLLQLYGDNPNADIAFGYDQAGAFTERMRVKGNGNVGIGTTSPYVPLTFLTSTGPKISLYGTSSNNYGFGVQGGLFQMYSDAAGADIAFGYGSSGAFTERMRIKGTGAVGIGLTNPTFPLEVNGRMRLWGTNPNDPGIWMNDAGVDRGFIGLQNNDHIGLYGSGVGWGFTMNTNTGALAVNGSEGSGGQVMTVNQANGAAQWASVASTLPSYYVYNSVLGGAYVDVPGAGEYAMYNAAITLNVPGNSRLIISANFCHYTFCPVVGSCAGVGRYYFKMDGNSTESQAVIIQGGGGYTSGSISNYFYDVGAGSHTIQFYTRPENGSTHYWAYLGSATIIVLRQ